MAEIATPVREIRTRGGAVYPCVPFTCEISEAGALFVSPLPDSGATVLRCVADSALDRTATWSVGAHVSIEHSGGRMLRDSEYAAYPPPGCPCSWSLRPGRCAGLDWVHKLISPRWEIHGHLPAVPWSYERWQGTPGNGSRQPVVSPVL